MTARVARSRGAHFERVGDVWCVTASSDRQILRMAWKDCAVAMGFETVNDYVQAQDNPKEFRRRMKERL